MIQAHTLLFLLCSLALWASESPFEKRRHALAEALGDGSALFLSAPTAQRNADVNYAYRQNSNFYYLTGFDRPRAALLVSGKNEPQAILFTAAPSLMEKIWVFDPKSEEEIKKRSGVDEVRPYSDLEQVVRKELGKKEPFYYDFGNKAFNAKLLEMLPRYWGEIRNTEPLMADLRLIKDAHEIEKLKRAIDITIQAQKRAARTMKPGHYEYEIRAELEYVFLKNGAERFAFPSIVGAGLNSTRPHYEGRDYRTQENDMVVIDIGTEHEHYAADITRTYPVNGKFSEAQREIYELVLRAQEAALEVTQPGNQFFDPNNASDAVLKEGLVRLGFVLDKAQEWQARIWKIHGISHWLGLDVHDIGAVSRKENGPTLKPGMVLTIEPGLYFNPQILESLKAFGVSEEEANTYRRAVHPLLLKYGKIGIRIEDDILITEEGHLNLSAGAPRSIEALEALMKESLPQRYQGK